MSHFEDESHRRFNAWEWNKDGDSLVMSNAAFMLHTSGMVNSIRDGHPGFVSDEYLNAITAETSLTATELCTLGVWERVEGGYNVLDDDGLQASIRAAENVSRLRNSEN